MKNAKKVFAMLIVLALAISMAIPVSAAAPTGTITIQNAKEGNTYSIYRIAELNISADGKNYAYYLPQNSPWINFLTTDRGFTQTPSVDGTGTIAITFVEPANFDEVQFAKDALAYAETNSIAPTLFDECDADATTVTFSNLPYGYYLVDTTVGTVCSLDTLSNGAVTINDKQTIPTIEKKVNGKDIEQQFIGQDVTYTIDVTVSSDGAINYKVTDKLGAGLTFKQLSSVAIVDDDSVLESGTGLETGKEYEVVDNKDYYFSNSGQVITVVFDNDTIESQEGKTIRITYIATVNENATANTAIPNDVELSYGDDPNVISDHVDVYTWDLDILKKDGTNKLLPGATFELYQGSKAAGNGVILTGGEGSYTYDGKGTTATKITGGSSFNIKGLKSGTYVLHEVSAPAGYNKLGEDIVITINYVDGATTVTYNSEQATFAGNDLTVVNNTGTELPHTGATGTIIFITVGGLMVVAMGVLLVVRKRMSKVVYTR